MDDLEFQALLIQNLRSNSLLSTIRSSFDNFDEFYEIYAKEQEKKLTQILIAFVALISGLISITVSISDYSLEWKAFITASVFILAILVIIFYLVNYSWFEREKREFKRYFRIFDRNLSKLNELKFSITSTDHLIKVIQDKSEKDHFGIVPEISDTRDYCLVNIDDLFHEVGRVEKYLEDMIKYKPEYSHYFNEFYRTYYKNLQDWWAQYKKVNKIDFKDVKEIRDQKTEEE